MGLFGLFGRKNRTEKDGQQGGQGFDDLELYTGLRVEVTTLAGSLLFIAKLLRIEGDAGELHQYSESAVSQLEGPIPVRIRGYRDEDSKAVYLEGNIQPDSNRIWKVERLRLIKIGNDRAFFRLETNLEAQVEALGRAGAREETCKLLNISVGGACIGTKSEYRTGERCLLTVQFLPDSEPTVLHCQILRTVKNDGTKFEYGCRFVELNEAGQDKIMQAIFALQRKKRGYT